MLTQEGNVGEHGGRGGGGGGVQKNVSRAYTVPGARAQEEEKETIWYKDKWLHLPSQQQPGSHPQHDDGCLTETTKR